MSMKGILIVGVLLAFKLIVQSWLMLRQRRALLQHRSAVPAAFGAFFTIAEHQKAVDYGRDRLKLSLWRMWFKAGVLVCWFYLGWLSRLDAMLFDHVPSSLWQPLALIAAVGLVDGLFGLPWSLYSQFVLEERYGFNRSTWKVFAADLVKGTVLGAIFLLLLGAPLVWLMNSLPGFWWIPAFAFYTCFQFLIILLWPTVIAPLFNKFTPLQDADLSQGIEQLVQGAGFKSSGVYVMDASKRSSHGNAYFTGLGRAKRIVFFDTLLHKLRPEQTLAVLAHEVGHLAHGHIKKGLVLSLLTSAVAFYGLGWLSLRADYFLDLGLSPTDGVVLLVATWLGGLVSVPLAPLMSWWSRRHEFQADRYAIERTSPEALGTALLELYRGNAGSLVVDPLYAAWTYSHPPLAERLAAMPYPARD
jgi:STE24 endopeptidase